MQGHPGFPNKLKPYLFKRELMWTIGMMLVESNSHKILALERNYVKHVT